MFLNLTWSWTIIFCCTALVEALVVAWGCVVIVMTMVATLPGVAVTAPLEAW